LSYSSLEEFAQAIEQPDKIGIALVDISGFDRRYSLPNTEVTLELRVTETEVIFSVEDAGIGIPAEDQERLFEFFYLATNVDRIPGTGLGLSIVKKCVDLHGGEITFTSTEGVGSKFTVTLPIATVDS
jgi:signal transduction histidine kinase